MGFTVFITFFICLMSPLFSVAGGYFHWWGRRQKLHEMPMRKCIDASNVASSSVCFRTSMAAIVGSLLLIFLSRGHLTAFDAAHGSCLPPLLLRFRCACLFTGVPLFFLLGFCRAARGRGVRPTCAFQARVRFQGVC